MNSKGNTRYLSFWIVPAIYAGAAFLLAFILPRIERIILPELISNLSIATATALYSAVASGMISLTAIVFSLVFVMVQFSATAYSPRLVLWIARDPVLSHALGIFIATFVYALAALIGVDRNGSGSVPVISAWVVVILLIVSIAMFIALVQRITLLQVHRMLTFTGNQGREVIESTYPAIKPLAVDKKSDYQRMPQTQTIIHHGPPLCVQSLNFRKVVNLAQASGAVIEFAPAIGDTVIDSMPLFLVFGAQKPISEQDLKKSIKLGEQRTFEQDPKYAIRLLVDIAIRALSPAVNDPTTAVQALDQIEDLLLRLSQRRLETGSFFDRDGNLRLVVPFATWPGLLALSFDEICAYGAESVQVMRRMNALVSNLMTSVPPERRDALSNWQKRLQVMIVDSFTRTEERSEASIADRQGLGGSQHSTVEQSLVQI